MRSKRESTRCPPIRVRNVRIAPATVIQKIDDISVLPLRFFRFGDDDGDEDAGKCTNAHMPRRADGLVGDDRYDATGDDDGPPIIALAEPHDETEKIDRQQHVDAKRMR